MSNGLSAELSALTIAPRGVLRSDFSTQDAASGLHLVDGIFGHTAQFAENDRLRVVGLGFPVPEQSEASTVIAYKFWQPGALPMAVLCDVWLKVTDVFDEGSHFRYAVEVQHNDGPDCRFTAGTEVVGYGQLDSQRILLSAADDDAAYVDVYQTGASPWSQTLPLVRVGQLDGLPMVEGNQHGVAIGSALTQPENPHIVASTEGLNLSQVDLFVSNGQATTACIGHDGSLLLSKDVDGEEPLGLSYLAETQALSVAGSLAIGGAGTFAGPVSLANGEVTTVRVSPNGDIAVGANVDDPEQTLFRLDTEANRLSLSADLAADGNVGIQGDLTIKDGDHATAMLKQSGDFRLGPNLQADGGIHLHYDPVAGRFAIAAPLNLDADLVSSQSIALLAEGKRTVFLGADGTMRVGTDTATDDQTALAYNPQSNNLDLRGTLRMFGDAESRGTLSFHDNGNQTAAIAPNGLVRFGSNIDAADGIAFQLDPAADNLTVSTELRLKRDTLVGGDLRLEGEAALLAGEAESVRIDRKGLQLRLEPGENNSIKVFGIGRAALINAYQTTNSMQELDVLAYYNPGVPALHGRLLLGVAGAEGQEPDTFLRMTRFFTGVRNIEMQASYMEIESERIRFKGNTDVRGNFDFSGTGGADRVFRLRNLPVSPNGLPVGAVWNDGGTLKIV